MIMRIEKGEANGILAWHPDRLARNSVDGGKIIYLLDCGHLQALKCPTFWAEELNKMLEKDKTKTSQSFTAFVQENKKRIVEIQIKLQRLLDGYLEQDIEKEIYRTEKAKMLSEKKSLEEKITGLEQKQNGWFEPMKEWIKVASSLEKTARDSNLTSRRPPIRRPKIGKSNLGAGRENRTPVRCLGSNCIATIRYPQFLNFSVFNESLIN